MNDTARKEYIFASDFDQTLTFNDSGYVLSRTGGDPDRRFRAEVHWHGAIEPGATRCGARLPALTRSRIPQRVRKEHLYEVGKRIRLKENIALLYQIPGERDPTDISFDFYMSLGCARRKWSTRRWREWCLRTISTEPSSSYNHSRRNRNRSLTHTAGYGKVSVLDRLQATQRKLALTTSSSCGDGSSDVHVMLHTNRRRRLYHRRLRGETRLTQLREGLF